MYNKRAIYIVTTGERQFVSLSKNMPQKLKKEGRSDCCFIDLKECFLSVLACKPLSQDVF